MSYVERLRVPVGYWLIAVAFGLTFIIAIGGYFPPLWFALVAVLGTALIVGTLVVYGGVVVRVDDAGIRVGRSLLEWEYVAGAVALDAEGLRHRLGPGADARANLWVRPYLRHGVEIALDDPADPHPYWLVGSRHPERLAAAITAHLPAAGG
ncbi:DUF3093 domain-containing protein [Propionicicella superfundia]|uniref:DUF3093 domain-containing protein n=1 Tax=Propionicicella superfundia TaxID=348582 RepID=UPI0004902857|nr:DUF3093 domain-containing protein [Propionicicella superfundia]